MHFGYRGQKHHIRVFLVIRTIVNDDYALVAHL